MSAVLGATRLMYFMNISYVKARNVHFQLQTDGALSFIVLRRLFNSLVSKEINSIGAKQEAPILPQIYDTC
jgi:hypothetical protein